MTALIIEDEYPAAERLTKLIKKIDADFQVVEVLDSVNNAINWFDTNAMPDLIFSDIQLSDGLSFEIFESVLVKSPVIFTTSYDAYAIKAFKLRSIDYLLKPIKIQELQQAMQKFKDMSNTMLTNQLQSMENLIDNLPLSAKKYKSRFLVRQQDQLLPIAQEEIAYFLTSNEMVCLVTKNNKQFLVDYKLEDLENLLNPQCFFRINRQIIAHIDSIATIHLYFNGKLKLDLKPTCNTEVFVSREKASLFKTWVERG
jgi:DNA-binding LytR/AlgR family response regulator